MPNKFLPPQTDTATRTASTPIQGEMLYDTDEDQLYYGDGATTGGVVVGGAGAFADLSDVDTTGLQTGQAMVWNGTVWVPGSTGREVLTANRTYYVRTDGSDSNDGLTDSAGGAFLTIQKFFDVLATLDKNGFAVTCQVADGTYLLTESIIVKDGLGFGKIFLVGNELNPNNVTLTSADDITYISQSVIATLEVKGFYFVNTGNNSNVSFLRCKNGVLAVGNNDYGATSTDFGYQSHLSASLNGVIAIVGSYTISGRAYAHFFVSSNGTIVGKNEYDSSLPNVNVTIVNTPSISIFAWARYAGIISLYWVTATFTGAVTGQRYNASTTGCILTEGGGANYFPGSTAGATSNGGIYN